MKELPVLMIDNRNPICCRIMQFLFRNGGSDKFCFLSINSIEGKRLLANFDVPDKINRFMILLDRDKIFLNSGAFLESTRRLNGSIPVFTGIPVYPKTIQNNCMMM